MDNVTRANKNCVDAMDYSGSYVGNLLIGDSGDFLDLTNDERRLQSVKIDYKKEYEKLLQVLKKIYKK